MAVGDGVYACSNASSGGVCTSKDMSSVSEGNRLTRQLSASASAPGNGRVRSVRRLGGLLTRVGSASRELLGSEYRNSVLQVCCVVPLIDTGSPSSSDSWSAWSSARHWERAHPACAAEVPRLPQPHGRPPPTADCPFNQENIVFVFCSSAKSLGMAAALRASLRKRLPGTPRGGHRDVRVSAQAQNSVQIDRRGLLHAGAASLALAPFATSVAAAPPLPLVPRIELAPGLSISKVTECFS